MILVDEIKRELGELAPEVTDLADALAIERSRLRLEELEQRSADPAFYNDTENSAKVFAEMSELKDRLESYHKLQEKLSDSETLVEMLSEEEDEDLAQEAQDNVEQLKKMIEEMRLVTLLTGEYDANNAILTFHAGAGGTEAQDWVSMLYRMYTRFAANHGWNVQVLDYLDGDEASGLSREEELRPFGAALGVDRYLVTSLEPCGLPDEVEFLYFSCQLSVSEDRPLVVVECGLVPAVSDGLFELQNEVVGRFDIVHLDRINISAQIYFFKVSLHKITSPFVAK